MFSLLTLFPYQLLFVSEILLGYFSLSSNNICICNLLHVIYLLVSSDSSPPSLFYALILCVLYHIWTTSSLPISSTFLGVHANITPWVVIFVVLSLDPPPWQPLGTQHSLLSQCELTPNGAVQGSCTHLSPYRHSFPSHQHSKSKKNTVCAGDLISTSSQQLNLHDVVTSNISVKLVELGEKLQCEMVQKRRWYLFTNSLIWLTLWTCTPPLSEFICFCCHTPVKQAARAVCARGLHSVGTTEAVRSSSVCVGLSFAWWQQMTVWTDLSYPFRTVSSYGAVPAYPQDGSGCKS